MRGLINTYIIYTSIRTTHSLVIVHGESFPSSSLSICEDCSVVSLQGGIHHGPRRRLIHFLLRTVLVVDIVEHEGMCGKSSSASWLNISILYMIVIILALIPLLVLLLLFTNYASMTYHLKQPQDSPIRLCIAPVGPPLQYFEMEHRLTALLEVAVELV